MTQAFAAVGALLLLGYLPTLRLGGRVAIAAMLAGCALSLVASLIGTLPLAVASRRGRGPGEMLGATIGSIALRFSTVLVLAVVAVTSGELEPLPLLLWVAICHAGLLIVDTRYARAMTRG